MILNKPEGPYNSCHVLSFFDKLCIKGFIFNDGLVVKKWINQREIDDSPIFRKDFDLYIKINPSIILLIKIKRIRFLYILGMMNNWWGFVVHVIIIPVNIEINLIREIGILAEDELCMFISGLDFNVNFIDVNVIRIVYDAVNPMDVIIIKERMRLKFEEIIISMIISLEKNPDVNGRAIKVILESPMIVGVSGELFINIPIIRMSWYEEM